MRAWWCGCRARGAKPKLGGQGIQHVTWTKVAGGWLVSAGVCHGGYTLAVGAGAPSVVATCGAIDDDGNPASP